ncbi:MAG: DUF6702 family protein [Blastocatellia bacterium]
MNLFFHPTAITRIVCACLLASLCVINPQSAIRNPPSNIPPSAIRHPQSNIHPSLFTHKFHVTNAQLEYNAAAQSAEIVIRVFADDFQTAISKHAGQDTKLDRPEHWKDKTRAALILSYINASFALKNKAGRPVKLSWIGMEGQADMFWLYVEGKIPGGLAGAQLRNRLHCELFDDQVNVVTAKFQGKQVGMMFEPKDEFREIVIKN